MSIKMLILCLSLTPLSLFAQTLQKVTDSSNTTTNVLVLTAKNKLPTTGKGMVLALDPPNNAGYLLARNFDNNTLLPINFFSKSILFNNQGSVVLKNTTRDTATGALFIMDETNGGRSSLILDANGGDGIGLDYFVLNHYAGTKGAEIGTYNIAPVKFLTNSAVRMVINENGNVGIGTSNPGSRLSVNGDILAKKVRVTLNASDWPDYVLRHDYDLPALDSVEYYIKQHGHLPAVPSASAIGEKGLELAEMQKIQMQKIEELTLYIIQQNKRIAELEKRLEIKGEH